MNDFLSKLASLMKERNSVICVGLDPAIPNQRDVNVIPKKYMNNDDENEARFNFCLDIIDNIADYAIAVKINEQYMFGMSVRNHLSISNYLKKKDLISIYDCKLGDIADSAESKLHWIHKSGYDGITTNPLPGNLERVVNFAHRYTPRIGIIVVTLMSNPEACKYFIESKYNSDSIYCEIANDVKKYDADGCVVGATKHIDSKEIGNIRRMIGKKRLILFPGIGTQKGDSIKAIKFGGNNILINIGRKIIYSDKPKDSIEKYFDQFKELRKRFY